MYAREPNLLQGFCFSLEGVPQDYIEAYKWLSLAASRAVEADLQTFEVARDALGEVMTTEQLAKARKRASDWQEMFSQKESV